MSRLAKKLLILNRISARPFSYFQRFVRELHLENTPIFCSMDELSFLLVNAKNLAHPFIVVQRFFLTSLLLYQSIRYTKAIVVYTHYV